MEKALADKCKLNTVIYTMKTMEMSKANTMAMRGLAMKTEADKQILDDKNMVDISSEDINIFETEF